jgi:hypothetical protein
MVTCLSLAEHILVHVAQAQLPAPDAKHDIVKIAPNMHCIAGTTSKRQILDLGNLKTPGDTHSQIEMEAAAAAAAAVVKMQVVAVAALVARRLGLGDVNWRY